MISQHSFVASSKLFFALRGIVPNFLLPLLSSSCCLVQLLINVFVGAGGCAGFNSILGPVRPFFLAIFIYLNAITGGGNISNAMFRFSVAFLPEIVYFRNAYATTLWTRRVEIIKQQQQQEDPNRSSLQQMIRASMTVNIPTMGCVACINKIESTLRNCAPADSIISVSAWLENDRKGGSAKVDVTVNSQEELDDLSRMVVKTIEGVGFQGSTISNVQILSDSE
jgi:copper chaperone CopZ